MCRKPDRSYAPLLIKLLLLCTYILTNTRSVLLRKMVSYGAHTEYITNFISHGGKGAAAQGRRRGEGGGGGGGGGGSPPEACSRDRFPLPLCTLPSVLRNLYGICTRYCLPTHATEYVASHDAGDGARRKNTMKHMKLLPSPWHGGEGEGRRFTPLLITTM